MKKNLKGVNGMATGQSQPLPSLTVMILTCNEEDNIARTLAAIQWAHRILAVDSGSSDSTLRILSNTPGVEVAQRAFDSFAEQCNFGLSLVQTDWVLSLDADYCVTPGLAEEILRTIRSPGSRHSGYYIPFRYCIGGRPLRGSLLPPRLCLYRKGSGAYVNDGHGHRYVLQGFSGMLRNPILHDDRKPLARWLHSQERYLRLEVEKLLTTPRPRLSRSDRLRLRHVIAPFAVLVLCLVVKRGLLDGWRGWFYAFQRMYVETLLSLMLWEARQLGQRPPQASCDNLSLSESRRGPYQRHP